MYRAPLLNRAIVPALAMASLTYATYATGVMQPATAIEQPLSAPPMRAYAATVAAVGLVEPASELVAVSSRVPGWIQTVQATAGQIVEIGAPLFSLDDSDLRAELALREQAVEVAASRVARLRSLPRPEDVPIARAAVAAAEADLGDAQAKLRIVEAVADPRAVSDEDRSERRQSVAHRQAQLASREAELVRLLAGAWTQDLVIAEAELRLAQRAAERVQADIERLTTRSPMRALVLKVTARAGQYAPAGVLEEPLVTIGSPGPLHVRADINEEDVPRIGTATDAVATVRGNGSRRIALELVRTEPLVVPKRALSGFAQERVDTRVMQMVFRVRDQAPELRIGQQVDIYIQKASSGISGEESR